MIKVYTKYDAIPSRILTSAVGEGAVASIIEWEIVDAIYLENFTYTEIYNMTRIEKGLEGVVFVHYKKGG